MSRRRNKINVSDLFIPNIQETENLRRQGPGFMSGNAVKAAGLPMLKSDGGCFLSESNERLHDAADGVDVRLFDPHNRPVLVFAGRIKASKVLN